MGLDRLITSIVVNSVRSVTRIDTFVDNITDKITNSPFSLELLEDTINTKNKLSSTLVDVQSNIKTINSTTNTLNNIVGGLKVISNIITSLPVPVSFPSLPGIPIGAITTFSSKLNDLKESITISKNMLEGAKGALTLISSSVKETQDKLDQLDIFLNSYIQNNLDKITEEEQNHLLEIIRSGERVSFSTGKPRNEEKELENKLQINADNPVIYKNYRLELQYDPKNRLTIPRRRIIGKNKISPFNLIIGDFSYTTKLRILLEEIKFQIDLREQIIA